MALTLGAALPLIAATACTGGGSDDGSDDPPRGDRIVGDPNTHPWEGDIVLASALVPFDACDDLLDYVKGHGRDMVGPWGLGGGWYGDDIALDGGEEEAAQDTDDSGAADGRGAIPAPVEGEDYSGTNVQEVGVDEPDNVKTDGEYLYLLRGEYLDIVDVRTDTPNVVSSTKLDGYSDQLLRADDRLLVQGYTDGGVNPLRSTEDALWTEGTMLSLYDVSDPANPALVSTLQLDGHIVSARLVDGVARVVLQADPVGLPFVTPEGQGLKADRDATERNREIIDESTAENWIPYYVHTTADGAESDGQLLECDQVNHPDEFAGLGTTSVLSVDLSADLVPRGGAAVLAGANTVYASAERLYVATNRWVDWVALNEDVAREANERFTTDIHAFDISDPQSANYVGSGSVRGHVNDQWSMSEFEGVLRVASTDGSPMWEWEESEPTSESYVTTFAERDGELAQLGQVGGLGKDERIYSVRFIGDVGYVVTFRETDPLYTLDLSDPENPEVLGELKILGYSAYLHPVGEDLLLGVGQDADEQGRTEGMQLSLFDISDLTDPQRTHQVTLSDAYSEAEWDHHAFLHWPQTGLTVVPFQKWEWNEEDETETFDNGAVAYKLDRNSGFDDAGRLTHLPADALDATQDKYYDLAWRAAIERSIVIGDSLVTISNLGVKVSDLDTLDDQGWVGLPARDY
jgi:uncharacterized secreted protein with C-terminal beta-propeller domain